MSIPINLYKNQESIQKLIYSFGLRWNKISEDLDLDLFAIQSRNNEQFKFFQRVIYYNNPRSLDPFGSTRLTKLNQKGRETTSSENYNLETLITDVIKTPKDVREIFYCIACPNNTRFGNIPNCQFKVVNLTEEFNEILNIDVTQEYPSQNACVLYKLTKNYPDIRNNPSLFTWQGTTPNLRFSSGMEGLLEYYS